jgi:hypothetical protein
MIIITYYSCWANPLPNLPPGGKMVVFSPSPLGGNPKGVKLKEKNKSAYSFESY